MKLVVLGANGGTGRFVLRAALERDGGDGRRPLGPQAPQIQHQTSRSPLAIRVILRS